MQPQQPTPQAPPTPLYATNGLTSHSGGGSILSLRNTYIAVYPGWVLLYNPSTKAEVRRIPLTPDVVVRQFLSFVYIRRTAGQRVSLFTATHTFMFASIWWYAVLTAGLLVNLLKDSIRLTGDLTSGQPDPSSTALAALGFGLILVGLVGLALGTPTAGRFKAALHRGAGKA